MKKRDFITLITIFILILFSFIAVNLSRASIGSFVKITVDGQLYDVLPLSENTTIELDSNTIVISDGKACMSEATCNDKLCKSHSPISKSGESIVCLPNRVVIEIIDKTQSINRTMLHFDTVISVNILDTDDESIIQEIEALCDHYELICSRTDSKSELYMLNNRTLPSENVTLADGRIVKAYRLSNELFDMISTGLTYAEVTDGVFDITIAPLCELWDISSGNNIIPSDKSIDESLLEVSYKNVILMSNNRIALPNDSTKIDLGGLAKGYIGDRIKELLQKKGIKNATISLGGDCVVLGKNHGTDWRIGIQKPFDTTGSSIKTISLSDTSIVTSGIYERYFKKNGQIYHHILSPFDGHPYTNDLLSVTIISSSGVYGDVMSTYLYSLGPDAAAQYAKEHSELKAILVDKNYNVIEP